MKDDTDERTLVVLDPWQEQVESEIGPDLNELSLEDRFTKNSESSRTYYS